MSNRIKDWKEPLPFEKGEMVRIDNPLIIIHDDGKKNYQFIINVTNMKRTGDDLCVFAGILMSDLIDHIAFAFRGHLGRDERDIRSVIFKVMKDEDRFKQKDPSRASAFGKFFTPDGDK